MALTRKLVRSLVDSHQRAKSGKVRGLAMTHSLCPYQWHAGMLYGTLLSAVSLGSPLVWRDQEGQTNNGRRTAGGFVQWPGVAL